MTEIIITRDEYNALLGEKKPGDLATLDIDSDRWDMNSKQWIPGPPAFFTVSSALCDTIEEARAEFESWFREKSPTGGHTRLFIKTTKQEYIEDKHNQMWCDACFLRGTWFLVDGKMVKVRNA